MLWLAPGNLFLMLGCLAQPEYFGVGFLVLWQLYMPCSAGAHGSSAPFKLRLKKGG